MAADDPARLADARHAVGANLRVREDAGNSARRNASTRSAWARPSSTIWPVAIGSSGVSNG
jgi:hypothetical protein